MYACMHVSRSVGSDQASAMVEMTGVEVMCMHAQTHTSMNMHICTHTRPQ